MFYSLQATLFHEDIPEDSFDRDKQINDSVFLKFEIFLFDGLPPHHPPIFVSFGKHRAFKFVCCKITRYPPPKKKLKKKIERFTQTSCHEKYNITRRFNWFPRRSL